VTRLHLGRPWRAWAKTAFIKCDLPKQIVPEGWDNWSNGENEKTAYYAEYKNSGEGAATAKRVSWSKQLTDQEAREYSLENIFVNNINAGPNDANWFKISSTSFYWPLQK
jgi:pectinesterase